MGKIFVVLGVLLGLSLTACGGPDYRRLDFMRPEESSQVERMKHDYSKCILQQSLSIDDGVIDPFLIANEGARRCATHLNNIKLFLYRSNFYKNEIDVLTDNTHRDSIRKAVESVLTVRN
ncbi:MAG: hypothetical protein KKE73_00785 [Proteobacteria bacterium]|nr:hypothetical protein [Pseudomonadota bacterium]